MKIHYTFFIWLISLFLIANFTLSKNFLLPKFANWDGGHYLTIAKSGYINKFEYAFFPLYPLLIRILSNLTGDYLISALLISVGSSFLAVRLLYKLVAAEFDKKLAQKTIVMLLIFPTSFYLISAYSESLFLLLAVATFYFSLKNNLEIATIFAILASATRLTGLAVVLGFLTQVLIFKGVNKKNWYVYLAPLGFIIYAGYLFTKTGDPFYFLTAEQHWLRSLTIPGLSFWDSIKQLANASFSAGSMNTLLDLLFAVFGLGLVVRSFRFLPISYSVYAVVSIMLPLFTPSLGSISRFLLPIFPIFILLAFVKNQYIIFAYEILSLMLLGLFFTHFLNGMWVA